MNEWRWIIDRHLELFDDKGSLFERPTVHRKPVCLQQQFDDALLRRKAGVLPTLHAGALFQRSDDDVQLPHEETSVRVSRWARPKSRRQLLSSQHSWTLQSNLLSSSKFVSVFISIFLILYSLPHSMLQYPNISFNAPIPHSMVTLSSYFNIQVFIYLASFGHHRTLPHSQFYGGFICKSFSTSIISYATYGSNSIIFCNSPTNFFVSIISIWFYGRFHGCNLVLFSIAVFYSNRKSYWWELIS